MARVRACGAIRVGVIRGPILHATVRMRCTKRLTLLPPRFGQRSPPRSRLSEGCRRPAGGARTRSSRVIRSFRGNGLSARHALRTRLPLQVREHAHSAVHMLRGHHDDFGADAVEFQIDPEVIERQVAYAE